MWRQDKHYKTSTLAVYLSSCKRAKPAVLREIRRLLPPPDSEAVAAVAAAKKKVA